MMTPKFNRKSVNAYTQNRVQTIERVLTSELIILAEQGVNIAREEHGYTDQTGNLTSSIGYELYVNGKSVRGNFEAKQGTESGEQGVQTGRSLAAEIGPLGNFSLIFVAGMPYAEKVEAMGKAVLTPAYLFAEQELPKLKARLIRLFG